MKINIVLGMGFGDEGKGIVTDSLCAANPENDKIVVRFSGGQQAGHAVKVGDKFHIHSSFGSGTLRGIPSMISEYCTFYPPSIIREYEALIEKGIEVPVLYIHPKAHFTTLLEIHKNRKSHKNLSDGTCGLGVGETMKRNLETPNKLYAVDLLHEGLLYHKLYINEFNTWGSFDECADFEICLGKMLDLINQGRIQIIDYRILLNRGEVIFEGSQGIMLDMDHGTIPNVTYANTTSKNALQICEYLKNKGKFLDININYVTRCYGTRHGNGWTPKFSVDLKLKNNEFEINTNNEFQGNFKTFPLDESLLIHAFNIDDIYSFNVKNKNLYVTCLDQIPEYDAYEVLCRLPKMLFGKMYGSYSPDSSTIKKLF